MERNIRLNWQLLIEEARYRREALGLSQAKMAASAGLAKGTISRFENMDKDIRLSSALTLLERLGLLDTRWISFDPAPGDFDWNRDIVQFSARDGEKVIPCAISTEALEDHFSESPRLKLVVAFEQNRKAIEHIARRKYLNGEGEADGSILIRSRDF